MTENRALKQAVRARAARTGEKYTQARRAVLAADNGAEPTSVTVTSREVMPIHEQIDRVTRRGAQAIRTMLTEEELTRFEPIEGVEIPDAPRYEIADVDTGLDLRNVTPDDALKRILERGRSPLTLEEGIAVAVADPELVAKNAGFSLAGSRCGDRRVTAWWLAKEGPKLGWCWAGNPHTWLGTASCGERITR